MCLVLLAHRVRADAPLVVLANRDEFYERPTEPLHEWAAPAGLFAGRDLLAKGTWQGLGRNGRFGALTNFRAPEAVRGSVASRGDLIPHWIGGSQSPAEFGRWLETHVEHYNPFNLLYGTCAPSQPAELWCFESTIGTARPLPPGVYGLCNAVLDTPWPKLVSAKAEFAALLATPGLPTRDSLGLMADRTPAADSELPDTGVGLEWERALSPVFVQTPTYGTRATTLTTVLAGGNARIDERRFNSQGFVVGTVTAHVR